MELNCIDAQDCGLKRIEKVVTALLPWHPLTSPNHCLFRQRFCSGGRVCRQSILLASWKLPLPHLPFEWASKSRLLEGTHDDAWWCMMMHDIVNRKQSMIIIQSAQHNEMRKRFIWLILYIYIYIYICYCLFMELNCIDAQDCVLKRWLLHCSPDIPWHALTIASSGSGFAVEEGAVDGASYWHHGKFICHTYLLNGHPSQDCWKLCMMMHDDAWWCMIMHDDAWWCMV